MKIGIISDIHEDIIRLENALKLLEKHACDEIACLGDIVGFSVPAFSYIDSRNANACVDLVKKNCRWVVAGNHDLAAVQRIPKHNAGFQYSMDWYQLSYKNRLKLAGDSVWLNEENELNALLGDSQQDFLSTIPEYAIVQTPEVNILLTHYLFPDLTGSHRQYYENFGPVTPHLSFIQENSCQLGISGHRHVEGCYVYRDETRIYKPFGSHLIDNELQWVVGPCIANAKMKNGFMVFDSSEKTLEIVSLGDTPKMLSATKVSSLS